MRLDSRHDKKDRASESRKAVGCRAVRGAVDVLHNLFEPQGKPFVPQDKQEWLCYLGGLLLLKIVPKNGSTVCPINVGEISSPSRP